MLPADEECKCKYCVELTDDYFEAPLMTGGFILLSNQKIRLGIPENSAEKKYFLKYSEEALKVFSIVEDRVDIGA